MLSEFESSFRNDSISSDFVRNNLVRWYDYQTNANPYFKVDSFIRLDKKPLTRIPEAFEFTPDFAKAYSRILSYSPDSSSILDSYSSQVELKELSNGKYGGLYTVSVRPYLIIPSKKTRYFLSVDNDLPLIHDNVWVSDSILIIVGTSNLPEDKKFYRYYNVWVLDFKLNSVSTWINLVPDRNYHVDEYVPSVRMKGYDIWLDED